MKIYTCFPHGKTKALTMSYDDGRLQDERLVGIFNRCGLRGTFNLNYGIMQYDRTRIPAERVKELYAGMRLRRIRLRTQPSGAGNSGGSQGAGMASNLPSQYIGSDGTGRIFC